MNIIQFKAIMQRVEGIQNIIISNEETMKRYRPRTDPWWELFLANAGLYKEMCFLLLDIVNDI